MKKIMITGANGMIGNLILHQCLLRDDVLQVVTITRKKLAIANSKLTQVVHDNFQDFSIIENHFNDIDACFYCLGVYTGQVPNDIFKIITVDYTKVFAQLLKAKSPNSTFCFLSGQGADSTEKSKILFAREKGMAENILIQLQFKKLHLFRPGYIYPVTPRKEPNLMYKTLRYLYKPLAFVYPNIGVTSDILALKMINVGLSDDVAIVFENAAIREK